MEFIFTVIFRGFSALQLTLRSTLIPKHQSSPSQNLCKCSWAKNGKRSNCSPVVKAFHAKLPVTRITSEICTCVPRYSTCKQSAARSETPRCPIKQRPKFLCEKNHISALVSSKTFFFFIQTLFSLNTK